MSSHQQMCHGGAVDSTRARKRSRLLPSSAGGTSQAELLDLEGSAGGEVIDLTGETSEAEVIVTNDNESAVDREQSQQQPHLSRAPENSAEPLARDDEEEPRDNQGAPPAGPASPPTSVDNNSEDREHPHFFRAPGNSAELPARDDEEEPRDNQGWPENVYVAQFWMHYYSEWWYLRRQPHFVRAEDNSAMLVVENNEEEQRDDDHAQPAGPASPPTSEDEDSELLQEHEQERRNVTLNRQEQVDSSGNGTGANDAPVAEAAPAEQGAEEEDTASSRAQQGVVISCPICMDVYSEIVQSERQLVTTLCGHVFCSRCLPIALETADMCPTCRVDLNPELYHPIYL